MPFGLQTAGKIASAPFKLVGGIGKQLLNVLPFGNKTKGRRLSVKKFNKFQE